MLAGVVGDDEAGFSLATRAGQQRSLAEKIPQHERLDLREAGVLEPAIEPLDFGLAGGGETAHVELADLVVLRALPGEGGVEIVERQAADIRGKSQRLGPGQADARILALR